MIRPFRSLELKRRDEAARYGERTIRAQAVAHKSRCPRRPGRGRPSRVGWGGGIRGSGRRPDTANERSVRKPSLTSLVALAALGAAALPASAGAEDFAVRGGGWGHGVGMSQYGAQGYALHGVGYRRILSHYYRRTTLDRVNGRRVRVLLQASRPEPASFSNATGAGGKSLDPDRTYRMRARDGRL